MFPPVPAVTTTAHTPRPLCPRNRPVLPAWVHVLILSPAAATVGLLIYAGSL